MSKKPTYLKVKTTNHKKCLSDFRSMDPAYKEGSSPNKPSLPMVNDDEEVHKKEQGEIDPDEWCTRDLKYESGVYNHFTDKNNDQEGVFHEDYDDEDYVPLERLKEENLYLQGKIIESNIKQDNLTKENEKLKNIIKQKEKAKREMLERVEREVMRKIDKIFEKELNE